MRVTAPLTPQVMFGALAVLALSACTTQTGSVDDDKPIAATHKVEICPRMQVSNAPAYDASTRLINRSHMTACVNNRRINLAPATGACLSSGFGNNGRNHKGLDYQSRPAGPVVSAAEGKVVFTGYRQQDFGNFVILDHGNNLYTGYAHLATVDSRVSVGAQVVRGAKLGVMGATGDATRAIHLHFETRTGTFMPSQPSSWFMLQPRNPFAYPERCN